MSSPTQHSILPIAASIPPHGNDIRHTNPTQNDVERDAAATGRPGLSNWSLLTKRQTTNQKCWNILDDHDSIANVDIDEKAEAHDIEKRLENDVLKRLSFVDRFLALWIFLAMAIGITLGKTVPGISQKLEKGTFVGTPVPIGVLSSYLSWTWMVG